MISFSETELMALVTGVLLPLIRVLGLFATAPVLSQRTMPARAKVGLAFLISVVATPVLDLPPAPVDYALIALVVHELAVGLVLGFIARMIFAAFEIAGETIGLQMGLSFAGFFDPQSGAANPVARLLNIMALTSFVMLNGPGLLIAAIVASFQVIPITTDFGWMTEYSPVALGGAVFSLALSIALPFMMLLLFVNLALGIMSRVAPQFSVFAVGFPVTLGIGMTLLTFTTPLMDGAIDVAMALLQSALPG